MSKAKYRSKVWINVFPAEAGDTYHDTREEADEAASEECAPPRLACIEVPYECELEDLAAFDSNLEQI